MSAAMPRLDTSTSTPQSAKQQAPQRPWMTEKQFSVIAGGAAGFVSTCLTNPFDVMRTRLAASRDATGASTKTMREQFRLMQGDGLLRSLTAGLGVNLATSIPTNAIYLSSYRLFKQWARDALGPDSAVGPAAAAAGAVVVTNGTMAPVFTLRTRCQLDPQSNGLSMAREIARQEGIRGFYRGALINGGGRMVEETIFWCLYENAKRLTQQGDMTSSGMAKGSAGVIGLSAATKIVGSFLSYPYNVVMTHLREVDKETGKFTHTKVRPTVAFIFRNDGWQGFYKGCTPHLVRCGLSKASQVWCFELLMFAGARYYHSSTSSTSSPKSAK